MRFQINETIHSADTQRVARLLEASLRDVAADTTCSEHQVVLRGLGPSPTAKNRRDVTILRLHSHDGNTIIDGDVTFQASALLGGSSQDEIVRSKLEQAFELVRSELRHAPQPPSIAPVAPVERQMSSPATTPAHKDKQADLHEAPAKAERDGARVTLVPDTPATVEMNAPKRIEPPSFGSPSLSLHRQQAEDSEVSTSNRRSWRGALIALAIVLVLLAGPAFYYLNHRTARSATASTQAAIPPITGKTPGADIGDRPSAVAAPETDPKVWLESWAAAMRSRDAVVQASFYAGTVDRYMDLRNVDRDTIQTRCEAAIRTRSGLWTVKMEKVVIKQPTESNADVQLVKHVMDEPESSGVVESFIPVHLTMRRVNGAWEITSEEDLAPLSPEMYRSEIGTP